MARACARKAGVDEADFNEYRVMLIDRPPRFIYGDQHRVAAPQYGKARAGCEATRVQTCLRGGLSANRDDEGVIPNVQRVQRDSVSGGRSGHGTDRSAH